MKNAARKLTLGLAASILLAGAAVAQLENENLLVDIPKGYKVGFQRNDNRMRMTEMVPANESVKDWTEMLTVQVFYGLKEVTPDQFRSRLEKLWLESCAGAKSKPLKNGTEGGYQSAMWVLSCPSNPKTSKPENTWFRAIQGMDSFYVVQKAFKFAPSKAQETQWMAFLEKVSVCDSRLPDRLCPGTKPQ